VARQLFVLDSTVSRTGIQNMLFMDGTRRAAAQNRIYSHAGGFSLISLVIGLGVGLLVIELSVHWLGISRRQWHVTAQSLLADRNSRTLFLSLKQDLNACGYRGFRQQEAHYPVEASPDTPTVSAIRGRTASTASRAVDPAWRSRLLRQSDILEIADIPVAHWTVQTQGSDFVQLKEKVSNKGGRLKINRGQRALMADAQGAAWLTVKAVYETQKRIVLHPKIHRIYGKNAAFTPVQQVTYLVARSISLNVISGFRTAPVGLPGEHK